MSNLVVFGCSHTTGMGIDYEDSMNHMNEFSKNAWPYVLGDLMNLNVINNAIPGIGCKETSYNILNYNFNKNDTVVILWPKIIRNCIINKNSITRLNHWYNDVASNNWFKNFQSDSDDVFSNFMYITAVEKILKNKVSSVTHSFDSFSILKKFKSEKILKSFYTKPFFSTYVKYGKGKDGRHLSEISHKMFANDLYKYINNKDII